MSALDTNKMIEAMIHSLASAMATKICGQLYPKDLTEIETEATIERDRIRWQQEYESCRDILLVRYNMKPK